MQETVLRQLVKIAGLQEMTIWQNRNNGWHLSVTVKSSPHVLYLSTRRAPADPCQPAGHARVTVSGARTNDVGGPCPSICSRPASTRQEVSTNDPKQNLTADRYQKGWAYADPHKNP